MPLTLNDSLDTTFPGILRELMKLKLPLILVTNYDTRELLQIQAAQKDPRSNPFPFPSTCLLRTRGRSRTARRLLKEKNDAVNA